MKLFCMRNLFCLTAKIPGESFCRVSPQMIMIGTAGGLLFSLLAASEFFEPVLCHSDEYEQSSDEQPQFIIYIARGDGTRGTFGGIVPTGALSQSDWFILDQKARRAMMDDDLANSESIFKQAIQKAEVKAMYEPGVINSFCGLAFLYHKKGNNAESERVYEYAMRYLEGVSGGRDSARFADYLPDLAWLYNAHGKPDKAEVLLKSAIAIRERRFGEYSKELEKSLEDYAYFLRKNGRDTEARHLDARIKLIQNHVAE